MLLEQSIEGLDGVWQVTNGLLKSNTYVGVLEASTDCFIIDPGSDTLAVEAIVDKLGLTPKYLFCTHGHFDHIAGANFFQKKYGAILHIPTQDIEVAKRSNFLLMAFGYEARITLPVFDVKVADQYRTVISGVAITYFAAPGHTIGSSIIQIGNGLFTGDTLYARGVALSKLPGHDSGQLRRTITDIFNKFDHQSLVFPGHGNVASLADIKANSKKLEVFLESQTN